MNTKAETKKQYSRKVVVTDHNGLKIVERLVESDDFHTFTDEYNKVWDEFVKKYPGNRHYIFKSREEDHK